MKFGSHRKTLFFNTKGLNTAVAQRGYRIFYLGTSLNATVIVGGQLCLGQLLIQCSSVEVIRYVFDCLVLVVTIPPPCSVPSLARKSQGGSYYMYIKHYTYVFP